MPLHWAALRKSVIAETSTLETRKSFNRARQRHPLLEAYQEPAQLLAFLHSSSAHLDQKDELLRTLVRVAQTDVERDVALSVLWAAMWPGLDGLYRRLSPRFDGDQHALVSAISDSFTECIVDLNLTTVHHVACALIRGTKRSVLQELQLNARYAHPETPNTDGVIHNSPAALRDHEEQLRAIRTWLRPIVGDDTALIVETVVLEFSIVEAAERLGLLVDTARQRRRRAMARIRQFLAEDLSQPIVFDAPMTGASESHTEVRHAA